MQLLIRQPGLSLAISITFCLVVFAFICREIIDTSFFLRLQAKTDTQPQSLDDSAQEPKEDCQDRKIAWTRHPLRRAQVICPHDEYLPFHQARTNTGEYLGRHQYDTPGNSLIEVCPEKGCDCLYENTEGRWNMNCSSSISHTLLTWCEDNSPSDLSSFKRNETDSRSNLVRREADSSTAQQDRKPHQLSRRKSTYYSPPRVDNLTPQNSPPSNVGPVSPQPTRGGINTSLVNSEAEDLRHAQLNLQLLHDDMARRGAATQQARTEIERLMTEIERVAMARTELTRATQEMSRRRARVTEELSRIRQRHREPQNQDERTRRSKRDRVEIDTTPINEAAKLRARNGKGNFHQLSRRKNYEPAEEEGLPPDHSRASNTSPISSQPTRVAIHADRVNDEAELLRHAQLINPWQNDAARLRAERERWETHIGDMSRRITEWRRAAEERDNERMEEQLSRVREEASTRHSKRDRVWIDPTPINKATKMRARYDTRKLHQLSRRKNYEPPEEENSPPENSRASNPSPNSSQPTRVAIHTNRVSSETETLSHAQLMNRFWQNGVARLRADTERRRAYGDELERRIAEATRTAEALSRDNEMIREQLSRLREDASPGHSKRDRVGIDPIPINEAAKLRARYGKRNFHQLSRRKNHEPPEEGNSPPENSRASNPSPNSSQPTRVPIQLDRLNSAMETLNHAQLRSQLLQNEAARLRAETERRRAETERRRAHVVTARRRITEMRRAAEELSRENEMMVEEIASMRERQREIQSQDASTRHS
jgi:hypothetical protein